MAAQGAQGAHDEVESAIQVEIDERVTRLAEKYFPELCESNTDPRAQLLFIDGIKWMADCTAETLDVIIVDSTDPIGPAEGLFNEDSPYRPNSPYSASKAASDHLVRAWFHPFGLPVVITNCSNNYGPYQFPEKLIPLMILRGLAGQPMPVYGDGKNVRDWLFVDDHAEALWRVVGQGRLGETYAIGGMAERCNLDVVTAIAGLLDELAPSAASHKALIAFVADRPGHDRRYAIDCAKIRGELGWHPRCAFEDGLRRTVAWYLANKDWWEPIVKKTYRLERLGTTVA